MPIQLKLDPEWSNAAVENVIFHGKKVASLIVRGYMEPSPQLNLLVMRSGRSIERLGVYTEEWEAREPKMDEVWQDMPSLRELFICQYAIPIGRLVAPNLVHLALEQQGCTQRITIHSTLDMLCGCPLLETLLIIRLDGYRNRTRACNHPPVLLPRLRSIELGGYEVDSVLITYLQFPPNIAAGFRKLDMSDICGDKIQTLVRNAMQHVLRRIDSHSVTLAIPPHPRISSGLFVRFEGLQGSLEITSWNVRTDAQVMDTLFGPRGLLFSHSPRIDNVRELHIVGCDFGDGNRLHHVSAAMPNVVSITYFDCEGPDTFLPLTPTDPSSPPFPHLERVMVLGEGSGLREMAKARRDCGVPLKTFVIGRRPGEEYSDPEDCATLGEFVGDLHIGCPTEILEWGTENEILNIWSAAGVPGPVSQNGDLVVMC